MDDPQSHDHRKNYNCIPMNTAMFTKVTAAGEPFTIDNTTIELVEIVGVCKEFNEQGVEIEITLQDSYGQVPVLMYRKDSVTVPQVLKEYIFKPKEYIHVFGHIRASGDKAYILAAKVVNMTLYSQVHFFKTKVLWNYLVRIKKIQQFQPEAAIPQNLSEKFATVKEEPGQHKRLDSLQEQTLNAIKRNQNGISGAKFDTFYLLLQNRFTREAVKSTVSKLLDDGFLYSVDDESYMVL